MPNDLNLRGSLIDWSPTTRVPQGSSSNLGSGGSSSLGGGGNSGAQGTAGSEEQDLTPSSGMRLNGIQLLFSIQSANKYV